jgi:hypothetical protein
MADMDKLKEKIRQAISAKHSCRDHLCDDRNSDRCICESDAAAALTAITEAGFVIMPKDQILRKMSKDEFSELMAGIPFRENDLGCQASPGIKGESEDCADG